MGARDVVIAGWDAVSSLGYDLDEQWRRALAGESGIAKLTRFAPKGDFPVRAAGQMPEIEDTGHAFLSPRHRAAWSSPVFPYALLTVVRALSMSGIEITTEIAPRVAVTYSTAIGGIDAVLRADRMLHGEGRLPHPYSNPNACINMVGGKIAMETGATGPIMTTITACATGLTSMLTGAMLLASGRADVAICGAVDCPLVEPIVAGFYTMNGVYSPPEGMKEDPPHAQSRPFSVDRRGFVLAEGAGAIILATEEFARTHGVGARARIEGWSMTSDAHHFVAPYQPRVRRCMEEAISHARVPPSAVDAVNAHAASTRVGDKVEHAAMSEVFGRKLPPVTANKSLIGHAMGASSAIETIFALRGMEEDILPPTINHRPDPDLPIDCVAEGSRRVPQEFVLKNAFGFGGCNACAVFRKIGMGGTS